MNCAKCGTPLAEVDKFCAKCGAPVAQAAAQPAGPSVQTELCSRCGTPWTAADKFCGKCGAPRGAGASPRPAVVHAAAPAASVDTPVRLVGAPASPAGAPAAAGAAATNSQKKALVIGAVVVVALLLVIAGGSYLAQSARERTAAARRAAAQKQASDFLRSFEQKLNTNQQPAGNTQANGAAASGAQSGVQAPADTTSSTANPSGVGSAAAPAASQPPVDAGPTVPGPGAIEHTVGGPEADLLVRTGYMDNFGYGWPAGYDVFSGLSTPPHRYPWKTPAGAPDGTDRILFGTGVTPDEMEKPIPRDGYSGVLRGDFETHVTPDMARAATMPKPIVLDVSGQPAKVDAILLQVFIDDFQVPVWHSRFQATLNDTRIPQIEDVLNAIDQTGPIGKLITVKLLPEYWPLLQSGTVKLLIDDPTTHALDGYAIGFVRVLVNPHSFKYVVSIQCTVVDADKGTPIPGATVAASLATATTDKEGKSALDGLPAGMVSASAAAPGYDSDTQTVDVPAGQTGNVTLRLHAHQESTAALERAIAQTGTATIYGIHFDTGSAKLRPDSLPALNAVLGLIQNHAGSKWTIAGHTDNQGNADSNQKLSEARAKSVITWLTVHGIAVEQLVPQGYGQTRPVADNATANGRALNRRVEVAPAK